MIRLQHVILLVLAMFAAVNSFGQTIDIISINGTCEGSKQGSVEFKVSGGIAPYQVVWSDGTVFQSVDTSSRTVSSLVPGIYGVTVTDSVFSFDTIKVEVTILAPAIVGNLVTDNDDGNCIASIESTPTGGYGGTYTYSWSSGSTNSLVTGICGGEYHKVAITDSGGCVASFADSVYLVTPIPIVQINYFKYPTCSEPCNGELGIAWSTNVIQIICSNGDTLDPLVNSSIVTGLCAGKYTITVSDVFGVAATTDFDLLDYSIEKSVLKIQPTCGENDGNLYIDSITIVGGAPPFTYLWGDTVVLDSAALLSNLSAGIYTVTITDSTGCVTMSTHNLKDENASTIYFWGTAGPTCNDACDGTLSIFASNTIVTYNVEWSTSLVDSGNTNVNLIAPQNICAGLYTVTLTDENNCVVVKDTIIPDPLEFILSEAHFDETICNNKDGSIDLTYTGGTFESAGVPEYLWNDGGTNEDISDLELGVYIVTVTDNGGCSAIQLVTIGCPGECDNWIEGTLIGDGNLISTGTVYLMDSQDSISYIDSTVSIVNGHFILANICLGNYKLFGVAPGYGDTYYYSNTGFLNAHELEIDSNSWGGIDLELLPPVGINKHNVNDGIVVYPNPTTGILNVVSQQGREIISIRVNEIEGNTVYKTTGLNGKYFELNLTNKENGIYVIVVETPETTVARKILLFK